MVIMLVLLPLKLMADEGMWPVWMIDKALEQRMADKGCELSANVIYDENHVSLSDAIVSLDFGCTGSVISPEGLMITNHHCAYSDIHALSSDENNYLKDGFWAMNRSEEVPIKGKGAWFLKKVIDITDEYKQVVDSLLNRNKVAGGRKVSHILESRYKKLYPYEVSLTTLWRGKRCYMAFYDLYKDLRLVAAPPSSIAAFGGEVDNWEWPQHKGDFAIYRIYCAPDGTPAEYSEENVPMRSKSFLKISSAGIEEGDYTMTMGYPYSIDRYASSFSVNRAEKFKNPVTAQVGGGQIEIIRKWMEADEQIRLKYSDYYFSLTNTHECMEGEAACYTRFNVSEEKRTLERELVEWMASKSDDYLESITDNATSGYPKREILAKMSAIYNATDSLEMQKSYYQQSLFRCARILFLAHRVNSLKPRRNANQDIGAFKAIDNKEFKRRCDMLWDEIDIRVERELLEYGLNEFYSNVSPEFWGDYLTECYKIYDGDVAAFIDSFWDTSFMTDRERFYSFIAESHYLEDFTNEPIYQIVNSTSVVLFNRLISEIEGDNSISKYEKDYTHLLYEMRRERGDMQYPDANATMRLSYGNITPLYPNDGVKTLSQSTFRGLIEKNSSTNYDYDLDEKMERLLAKGDWGPYGSDGNLYLNFITNNDITGGNSGSPVLNGRGELIGLAFDGNKESLSSNTHFHPTMNKCVCVDIRYVLWILDYYADMDYILTEIHDVNRCE